jgi:lysophospholipid acyltransferase (LPLAT)-like uncharacterized protein
LSFGVDFLGLRLSHYLVKYRLISLCYYFLRFYLSLLRVRVVGEDEARHSFGKKGRIIAAIWHQRFLPALAYVTKFRSFKPIVMISRSRDGELVAGIAERLGLIAVRGSSTEGGREALLEIARELRKNPGVIHIVDGPTGPKGVVKPGLIAMAQVSGAVILPIIVSANRAWIMRSWDQFLVPKPFSQVTIRWGEPFFVERKMKREEFEKTRLEIEKKLRDAYGEADLKSGWRAPL